MRRRRALGSTLDLPEPDLVAAVYRKTGGKIPIIGVGGVMTGEDAWQMIRAGPPWSRCIPGSSTTAPGFPASIKRHLLRRLSESGKTSLEEVIGEDARRCHPGTLQPGTGPAPSRFAATLNRTGDPCQPPEDVRLAVLSSAGAARILHVDLSASAWVSKRRIA